MPTETKNTAANVSRNGLTRRSMRCDSALSDRIEPMMKAPKATE